VDAWIPAIAASAGAASLSSIVVSSSAMASVNRAAALPVG
jgi:hypothetical protein